MSNHSVKFYKDLLSSFRIILLTDKQTDTGNNITSLARVKVKIKVRTLDIMPVHTTPHQKRSGMARVLKRSHSFTCTPQSECAIPAFTFSDIPDTHLPTSEGWKTELAGVVG